MFSWILCCFRQRGGDPQPSLPVVVRPASSLYSQATPPSTVGRRAWCPPSPPPALPTPPPPAPPTPPPLPPPRKPARPRKAQLKFAFDTTSSGGGTVPARYKKWDPSQAHPWRGPTAPIPPEQSPRRRVALTTAVVPDSNILSAPSVKRRPLAGHSQGSGFSPRQSLWCRKATTMLWWDSIDKAVVPDSNLLSAPSVKRRPLAGHSQGSGFSPDNRHGAGWQPRPELQCQIATTSAAVPGSTPQSALSQETASGMSQPEVGLLPPRQSLWRRIATNDKHYGAG
ncbi:uncharacterized protein KY384_007486 [Bacidia gigantensis]|uniref:uncharacterized protein n=1 Tax=Bacidia gigantensis TaxID=2732470 RepID=UPI001D042F79|nr:uncharacterized protein KY384_007486 [Bacidia gigantensis]KAG8527334.1 hypothetical protein KY384_007486 [Bacidia gigantensis]